MDVAVRNKSDMSVRIAMSGRGWPALFAVVGRDSKLADGEKIAAAVGVRGVGLRLHKYRWTAM